jgi:hypothetical protein
MATIGFRAEDQHLYDDLNFDFDDFNFDVEEPPDDRHPVIKAIAPVARGTRDYITNSGNIARFVKAALPVGYGQAADMVIDVKNEMRQLYNSAGKELRPAKESAKSLMRKSLPVLDGKIPKGLKKKLEEMSKEEQQWQSNQRDGREEQLGSLLTSIFEQKAKDEVRNREEHNERDKINQAFEQIRHRDQHTQLNAIRLALESQVQYQNRVDYNVQKKQLELQYRSFWALADLNKEQKRSNAMMLSEMKATRVNTALPDFVKQTFHEKFKELARNKFLDTARDGFFGGAQDYVRKFTKNIGEGVLGKVRTYGGAAGAVGGMADTAAETMQGMPGMNMRDELISMLMSIPLDMASDRGSQALSKVLGKNAKVRRGGSAASRFVNTAPDRLKQYLTSPDHSWGSLESIRELLANATPSNLPDSKMQVDRIDTLHNPSPFSKGNAKSLNEVIPGLLARIHREIKILRTGNEDVGLVTYDYTKNKFSTDKKLATDLKQRIAGKGTENANKYADSILGSVDRGGKLTPEQREKARQMLIQKAVMGESLDASNIHHSSHWGGGDDGKAIADRFNRYLRSSDGKLSHNDQSYKRQINLMRQHRGIVGGLGDPRVLMQQMVNTGQLDQLKEMGILDDANLVNRDLYAKWLMGQDDGTPDQPPVVPSTTGHPSTLGARRVSRSRNGGRSDNAQAGSVNLRQFVNNSNPHGSDIVNELRALSGNVAAGSNPGATTSIDENVKKIVDLLSVLDQKYEHASGESYAIMTEMLEALRQRGRFGGFGGLGNQGGGGDANPDPNAPRTYSSLWEHLKGTGKEYYGKGKKQFQRGKAYAGKLWDKHSPGVKQHASDAMKATGTAVSTLRGKLQGYYGDVVVAGEHYPRLRATMLAAGEYHDKATGKVITSLEDIVGDVVDSQGNLVITMEEFYNSYVTGSINKRVKELFSNAKSHLEDWKNRFQAWSPDALRRFKSSISGGFNRIKALLPPYDVYVKDDMTKPLLYANLMRHEKYFSQRTGKTIKHPRDIDGPVIDDLGNVVLSQEHLTAGIVDVKGDPAGPGMGRIISKIGKKVTHAWEIMRNAAVGIFGSISKGLGNAGEYFKNFFAPFGDMITNSRKTVTLLEQIRDLLDNRLPGKKKVKGDADGDGLRDGSIQELHQQQASQLALGYDPSHPSQKNSKADPGSKGLLASLTGLFKRKEKEQKDHEDDDHESLLDKASNIAEIGDFLNGDGHGKDAKARRKAAKARLKRMKARGKVGFMGKLRNMLPSFGRGAGAATSAAGAAGNAAASGGRLARLARWGALTPDLLMGAGAAAGAVARPAASLGGKVLKGAGWLGGKTLGALTGPGKVGRLARWGAFTPDLVVGGGKLLGAGARLLPRLLGGAGAAYSAYSAYDNLKQGNYGSAAIDAGLGIAGAATTVGGMAGLAGMGGTVLGGLGAILGSPLLVPALAIAGAGALAYMGYKKLIKTKLTAMSKVRLAQYGVNVEDSGSMDKVFALESMLEEHAKIENGKVTIDPEKLKLKEIAELFDVTAKEDLPAFNGWYTHRFMPVWSRWLSEVRKYGNDAKLGNVESVVPGKNKLQATEGSVSGLSEVYNYMLGWSRAHPKLDYDVNGVKQILESVRMDLMKEGERDGGKKAVVIASTTVATLNPSLDPSRLAKKAKEDTSGYAVHDKDGNTLDANGMSYSELREKIVKGEVTVDVAVNTPKELLQTDNSTLDALTSVRYKAYGLTYLTADKARTLSALEQFMSDQLTGDVEHPKLTMSTDKAMEVAGKVFGVPNSNGEHAQRWKVWFNGRFLPVFLLWAGTIRQKTGKTKLIDAHRSFPMTEQAPLARSIIGVKGKNSMGGIVPVWTITSNPWADAYELNTDPDSTAGNLEAIRLVADKVRLGEVTAEAVGGGPSKTHRVSKEVSDAEMGFLGKAKRSIGNMFGKDWSPHGEGVQAAGDKIITTDKNAKPLSGMGEAVKFESGGGGKYTDLPVPTGSGWSATRNLILQGAAMSGVDPRALIATISLESSFNPNAAPKNPNLPSSAKGLGQHLDGSWMEDLQRDGAKFGIPNGTTQFDARASVLMTAARLKFNGTQLQKSLGRAPTVADLYLAHLMGLGGATKFLKAPPDAIASEVAPTTSKQHPNYFFENGRALTVKETYAKIAQKLAKTPASFGVTDDDMKTTAAAATAKSTDAAPATGAASSAPGAASGAAAGAATGTPPSTATDTGTKSSVSMDGLRAPAITASVAPKETPTGGNPSFVPQMPKTTATTAPTVTGSSIPTLSKTDSSVSTGNPSKLEMQQRDSAMSSVIAPKMDKVTGLLENSLTEHQETTRLLRLILQGMGKGGLNGGQDAPASQASSKVKPMSTSEVPVPQRRTIQ